MIEYDRRIALYNCLLCTNFGFSRERLKKNYNNKTFKTLSIERPRFNVTRDELDRLKPTLGDDIFILLYIPTIRR